MNDSDTSKSDPLRQNLRRLIVFRLCILLGAMLAVAVARWGLRIEFPLVPVAGVAAVLAAIIVITAWRLSREWPVTEREMLLHLSIDVALITALLFFTGGASNPFVSLYLLPVVIAATIFGRTHAMLLTAVAVICYSALMVWGVPLVPTGHEHHADQFGLHVMGMWINFLLCAGLVLWIVARMAGAIRERDRLLALAREKTLRDEKILSLGLLAAGAAHELATPVSTLSVLLKEMRHGTYDPTQMSADVATLATQVDHCREVIQGLAASAGQARTAHADRLPMRAYVLRTLERWRLLRPAVPVLTRFDGDFDPWVRADDTLSSTLTSVLNNAADASAQGVEIRGRCERNQVIVEILDHGPGIADDVLREAGRSIITKSEGKGWGIGLFLANVTVERLGGSIVLLNRPEGGACTRITVPLSALQAVEA